MLCHSEFDFLREGIDAKFMHQDLDARLVDIVAPAELIVGAQQRFDVTQHVARVQERLDGLGKKWRAAKTAADHDFKAELARLVTVQLQR